MIQLVWVEQVDILFSDAVESLLVDRRIVIHQSLQPFGQSSTALAATRPQRDRRNHFCSVCTKRRVIWRKRAFTIQIATWDWMLANATGIDLSVECVTPSR